MVKPRIHHDELHESKKIEYLYAMSKYLSWTTTQRVTT